MSLQITNVTSIPLLHSSLPCPKFSGIKSIQREQLSGSVESNSTLSPRQIQMAIYRKIIKKSGVKNEDDLYRFMSNKCLEKVSEKFTDLFEKLYPCEANPTLSQAFQLIDSDRFSEALAEEKSCCPETKNFEFFGIDVQFYKKITGKEATAGDVKGFTSNRCLKKVSEKFTELFRRLYPCEANPTFDQVSELMESNLFSQALKEIDSPNERICYPIEGSTIESTQSSKSKTDASLHPRLIIVIIVGASLILGLIASVISYFAKHCNLSRHTRLFNPKP